MFKRDLRGQRFGRLTVKHFAGRYHRAAYWCCECDCGAAVRVRGSKLVIGRVKSCGCFRADPDVRRAARLKVPDSVRCSIAAAGGRTHKGKPRVRRDCSLSLDQVAEMLQLPREQVARLVDEGRIRARDVAIGRPRLSRSDVEALCDTIGVPSGVPRRRECSVSSAR